MSPVTNSRLLRTGALACLALAEQVSAHPRSVRVLDQVRLVGAVDVQSGEEAYASGKQLLAADDAVGALAAFQRTLAASPTSVDALNGIGVSYDRLGRTDLARSYYEAALELDPKSPRTLNNLGYSLFLRGDTAAATASLRAAASSSDVDAAAAATATLALIVKQTAVNRSAPVESVPVPIARIESTNDGEQRLVLEPADDAGTQAASEIAILASVASVWTDRDDAALLHRVRGEEHAEQLALAAIEVSHDNKSLAQTPASAEEQIAVLPASSKPTGAGHTNVTAMSRQVAYLVLGETRANATIARRSSPTERKREQTPIDTDPSERLAARFDSDDDELNAFAERMRSDAGRKATTVAVDAPRRIAARFRA